MIRNLALEVAMSRVTAVRTLADLIRELGVDADRILFHPPPGTATEKDMVVVHDHDDRLAELVEGVLVDKAMGFEESIVAGVIISLLNQHVLPRKLGVVAGSDGMVRYRDGIVQLADVAFFSWARFPDGRLTGGAISSVIPDLVVEVLSRSNSDAEMERKRKEYFDANVKLVWMVDHRARTVCVYTDVVTFRCLGDQDTLDGGNVLPEFRVTVNELFAGLA